MPLQPLARRNAPVAPEQPLLASSRPFIETPFSWLSASSADEYLAETDEITWAQDLDPGGFLLCHFDVAPAASVVASYDVAPLGLG